ncbi:MAG: GIY-YIG nuclease family protein, partial [Candidatus Nitrosomaritimum yanchengensis]
MRKTILKLKKNLNKLPDKSGVYLFKNADDKILYVGKAINIKNRLKSYFATKLERKTAAMVSAAKKISYIEVNSEIEALLLESKLVKKYKPKYNIQLRDDKSPLYIAITDDEYPRVVTLRQTQINNIKTKKIFGPFLNSTAPKKVLKQFRKIVPFTTHKPGKRGCVYSQIGLCNPCSSVVKNTDNLELKSELKSEYLKNIQKVSRMLSGQIKSVKKDLEKDLKSYSKKNNFEEAQNILSKIQQIDYVLKQHVSADKYIENPNLLEDIRDKELATLKKLLKPHFNIKNLKRIECFDVAHISGSYPTASMITFINGQPDKSLYRHFAIKNSKGNDDFLSMKEILTRRKKYLDKNKWGKPDLLVIDGGKGQLSSVKKIYDDLEINIPIVGLAKRFETLVFLDE